MSCKVILNDLPKEQLAFLKKRSKLTITSKSGYQPFAKPEVVSLTRMVNACIVDDAYHTRAVSYGYIPYALAREAKVDPVNPNFNEMDMTFTGALRDKQQHVKDKTMDHMNRTGSSIISCHPGFGKTITAINIACELKLKVLVVVNRVVLIKQWIDAVKQFCDENVVVQNLTSENEDVQANFSIVNVLSIAKYPDYLLESFGLVIIDEAHLILSRTMFSKLLHLTPKYLLALSATPYRNDDLNKLFPIFFGKNVVGEKLYKPHTVYKVYTNFKPSIKLDHTMKVNWNDILDKMSRDPHRNNLIVNLIKKHSDRVFLVLVKRVEQGKWLEQKLKEEGEHVSTLFGSNQTFDQTCRVLIGTNSKVGTGFDFSRLDTLLLGSDVVSYYVQFLGRVMRRVDVEPLIFDLVDDNSTLERHFDERAKVYRNHGGVVKRYSS